MCSVSCLLGCYVCTAWRMIFVNMFAVCISSGG